MQATPYVRLLHHIVRLRELFRTMMCFRINDPIKWGRLIWQVVSNPFSTKSAFTASGRTYGRKDSERFVLRTPIRWWQ